MIAGDKACQSAIDQVIPQERETAGIGLGMKYNIKQTGKVERGRKGHWKFESM